MVVKKSGKLIYGADLTAAEKKAMDIEIRKCMADYTNNNLMEMDAIILWILHEQLGFGEKRLRKFYDNFHVELKALTDRYEMDGEEVYLCQKKLKDIGIDIDKWHKEKTKRLEKEGF